ncbi:MAG TPA: hypothetical protein VNL16_17010 [Chloroflexota bacterium]|nr:hypothetical protein [Chloroflexota bacterium]
MTTDELIERYVESSSHYPGLDEARLRRYGVPVWALVGYLGVVSGDEVQVAKDYDVPIEAVEAALEYYRRHRSVIDARIAANVA